MDKKIVIIFRDQNTKGEVIANNKKDASEQIEILKQLGCTDIKCLEK